MGVIQIIGKLRGMIYSRHKSLQKFSDEIGWQIKKTHRIVKCIQEPTRKDMEDIAKHFALSKQEFLDLFFEDLFAEAKNDAS